MIEQARPLGHTLRAHVALLVVGALTTALGIAAARDLAVNVELVNWSFTHWAFSYEHGFVKRGLAGEVLTWFVAPAEVFGAMYWVALVSSVAVAVALAFVFWSPFIRTGESGALLLAVVATTHFATLQHHFYDVGRFDQLGLLLMLGCLAAVNRCRLATTAAIVAALAALGLVVHEAFLFIFLPVIAAYWIARQSRLPRSTLAFAVVAGWLLIVTALIIRDGRPSVSQDDYARELVATYGPWINDRSVQVLYGNLQQESLRSVRNLLDPRRVVQHAVLALFLLPTAVLFWRMVRPVVSDPATGAARPPLTALVILAAFSPLALYPIGIDFARWWALALTNLFVVLSLFVRDLPEWRPALAVVSRSRNLIWVVLALNLLAGPLGVAASPFPRIEPAIVALVSSVLHAVR